MYYWTRRKVRALGAVTASAAFAAGCATPPSPEVGYAAVTNKIVQAAAGLEPASPATLPPEPALSGPHPEIFYVRTALDRNPAVLAARRAVAATAETIPQQTALDDPMLSSTFWPVAEHSPQTASGRMPATLMLSQEVPWLTKLRVRGEVAEQETKIALTQLAQEELTVIEQVRLAYFDLYFYQQAVATTRENEGLLEDLVGFAEIRLRTGGSQQDVLRVQIEQDRLRQQLIDYQAQLEQTQADLAALLHASPEIEPLAADSLDLPPVPAMLDRLYELAARCRPELRGRLHAIVRDQRRRELARLDYYPDLNVGFDYDLMTENDAIARSADGNDNLGLSIGLNLPIYRDRLQAGVREAEHRVVEAARRYDAERDDTFRQIRRLIATAEAADRQLAIYRDTIIPQTEQALEISISDYQTGRGDILQVVDNYTELLAFEIQVARLEADLGRALASLERVVGCELAAMPSSPRETDVPPEPAPEPDASDPVPVPGEAPPDLDDSDPVPIPDAGTDPFLSTPKFSPPRFPAD